MNMSNTGVTKLIRSSSLMLCFVLACADDPKNSEVAEDLSRLTVLSAASMASSILEDDNCGFSNQAVKDAAIVEGKRGENGKIVYTIENCVLDYGESASLSEISDCNKETTRIDGRLQVTASLEIEGIVTGDSENPILPTSSEASQLRLKRVDIIEAYKVTLSDGTKMELREGSFSTDIKPRLAKGADIDACVAPTPNATIENLKMFSVNAKIVGDGESSDVFIASSDLSANIGETSKGTNELSGTITVFVEEITIGEAGKPVKFDPDFSAESFRETYSCESELAQPLSFTCDALTKNEELAGAIGRLSVPSVAIIAGLVASDTECGFNSPNALLNSEASGDAGTVGTITSRIENCTLSMATKESVSTDCQGAETFAQGNVRVTARQEFRGRITGDFELPIVPLESAPATIYLEEVHFEGFQLSSTSTAVSSTVSLELIAGTFSATVTPRLARSKSTGGCAILTPISEITGLTYQDAFVSLTTDDGIVSATVESSNLDAFVGYIDGRENEFSGQITVFGELHTFSDEKLLDDFSRKTVDDSWQCDVDLEKPVSFECNPEGPLVDAVARLSPQAMGVVLALVESDTNCGFNSQSQNVQATLGGALGSDSSITQTMGSCTLNFPEKTFVSSDCNGVATFAEGQVTVSGTKKADGFITGDLSAPLLPTSPYAISYDLQATFDDFRVSTSSSSPTMLIKSGGLSGVIEPALAQDVSTGVCSKITPNVQFDGLSYQDAEILLQIDDAEFGLSVSASDIDAVAGTYSGKTNTLSGNMTVNSTTTYTLPVDTSVSGLIPGFDQQAFALTYACDADLVEVQNVAQCSLRSMLAPAAARLLAYSAGLANAVVAQDSVCGLSSNGVLSAPISVVGAVGMPGSITHVARSCAPALPPLTAPQPVAVDCVGAESYALGSVTVTATRSTSGLRIETCVGAGGGPPCIPGVAPLCAGGQVQIDMSASFASEFMTYRGLEGRSATPDAAMTINGGRLTATVVPTLGESLSNTGVCSIPTPVNHLTNLSASNMPILLALEGRSFAVVIDSSDLEVRVGMQNSQGNSISGTIVIDGQSFSVSGPVDPNYSQAQFDRTYACTPDLSATIAP